MAGCITEDYKNIILGMLEQEMEKSVITGLVKAIPICPTVGAAPSKPAEKKRSVPEPWGLSPLYIDEKGKEQKFDSPSALVKHLNLPMSGIQCDTSGQKCKVMNAIDILRVHGYTVSGNGEPRKASQGGKKLTVCHPDSVERCK